MRFPLGGLGGQRGIFCNRTRLGRRSEDRRRLPQQARTSNAIAPRLCRKSKRGVLRQNTNTARTLVVSMRIDRDCSLDETQQQTRVPRTVKSTQQSTAAVRVSRTATSTHAPSLKLATDLARRVLSVLPMRLYYARGLVQRASAINPNPSRM